MSVQLTLSIVKPDAVRNHHTGAILARIEQRGLDIVAARMPCTVRIVQKTPPAKLPFSSPNASCAADERQSQPFRL